MPGLFASVIFTGDNFGFAVALTAAMMVGVAAGAETDLIAYLVARYFDLKDYGQLYGTMYTPFAVGSAISAPAYGYTYDYFGSYNIALLLAAGFFVAGAALLFFAGAYPDLDEDAA